MQEGIFIQYYNKQLASFRRHLRSALKSVSMEDMHKLRVSIKKLRILWSFMEVASRGKWKSRPCQDLIEKVFRTAGKFRESQINLLLIEACQADFLSPYIRQLKTNQKRTGKILLESVQAFDRKKFNAINRQLRRRMREVSDEAVFAESVAFALNKSGKVLALSEQLPDSGKLHKIRIHQKAVQEMLSVLKRLKSGLALEPLESDIRLINERIGDWHDSSVLVQSLGTFDEKSRENEDHRQLKDLIAQLEHQQEASQNELYRLLDRKAIRQQMKQLEDLPGI